MKFAIIKTGGKQYKVEPGKKIKVEKLEAEQGGAVVFDNVLLVADGDKVEIGAPLVSGAKISGNVVKQGRDKKKIVFRYHSKTRYRKKKGHRQPFTEVEIKEIKL
ncbi:MAG: 50S ribosomal protein L21 [Patescibacteria group bacterium]